MSDQEPMLLGQETAVRNLVSYIESDINKEGNKQLMLFLGICLGDIDIVSRAISLGVDVTEGLSNRNELILDQIGYGSNLSKPSSPISVQDISIN